MSSLFLVPDADPLELVYLGAQGQSSNRSPRLEKCCSGRRCARRLDHLSARCGHSCGELSLNSGLECSTRLDAPSPHRFRTWRSCTRSLPRTSRTRLFCSVSPYASVFSLEDRINCLCRRAGRANEATASKVELTSFVSKQILRLLCVRVCRPPEPALAFRDKTYLFTRTPAVGQES